MRERSSVMERVMAVGGEIALKVFMNRTEKISDAPGTYDIIRQETHLPERSNARRKSKGADRHRTSQGPTISQAGSGTVGYFWLGNRLRVVAVGAHEHPSLLF